MTIWQFMDIHPIFTVILIVILGGFIESMTKTIVNRNSPKCNCDDEED